MSAHQLDTADGKTNQGTERKRPGDLHLLSGDSRGRDESGHRSKVTEQGALTFWRQQRDVTSQDTESKPLCEVHSLPGDGRVTSQDTGRKTPAGGYSRTGHGRGMAESGHGNKATERGALTVWRRLRGSQVRTRKEKGEQSQNKR